MTRIPCSARAGRRSRSTRAADRARAGRAPARGPRPGSRSASIPSAPARLSARLDQVLEVGDPDHEHLVEVRLPDRRELGPLEQRHRRVLGELQDPVVEVEPGELAVEVERGILEVGTAAVTACRPAPLRGSVGWASLGLHRLHGVASQASADATLRQPRAAAWARACAATASGRSDSRRRAGRSAASQVRPLTSASASARDSLAQERRRGELGDGGGDRAPGRARTASRSGGRGSARAGRPRRPRPPAGRSPAPRRSPGRRCRCASRTGTGRRSRRRSRAASRSSQPRKVACSPRRTRSMSSSGPPPASSRCRRGSRSRASRKLSASRSAPFSFVSRPA